MTGILWLTLAYAHEVEDGPIEPTTIAAPADCVDGAMGLLTCQHTHLHAHLDPQTLGGARVNDVWGWADPVTGREIALVGVNTGVSAVDVTSPHDSAVIGFLPATGLASTWADIKVIGHHALVVSEARDHGMQVFDLLQLGDATEPVALEPVATHFGILNAHNVAVNEETGFAYVVGARRGENPCGNGLHMVDVRDPENPTFAGCFADDGYIHDVQCVNWHGPDPAWQGRELCFASSVDHVSIIDVTDKSSPAFVSTVTYPDSGYTHQGWLSEDHATFYIGDEADERRFDTGTRVHVFDVAAPADPFWVGLHEAGTAIDHNLFVLGDHIYQATYTQGLRVLRIGDPAFAELAVIASLDTHPESDAAVFRGAWGVYPYLPSGNVLVSDIQRGLFVVKVMTEGVPRCADGLDNDRDGFADYPEDDGCDSADDQDEERLITIRIAIGPRGRGDDRSSSSEDSRSRSSSGSDSRSGSSSRSDDDSSDDPRWLRVVLYGGSDIDVALIDRSSLRLGPGDAVARRVRKPKNHDHDRDGHRDMLAQFDEQSVGADDGTTELCLTGTYDGVAFESCSAR